MKFNLNKLGKWKWPAVGGLAGVVIILIVVIVKSTAAPDIPTAPVEFGEFIIDLNESGELRAVNSVSVSVPRFIRGNLRVVALAEDGSMVEEGDFLVQFDTSEAKQDVEERQSELENAEAELISLQATIKSNMAQLRTAYETQKYSYEQAKLRLEQMKYEAAAKIREQELNLKKSELALEQARKKIESQKIINDADLSKARLKVKQARMRLEQEHRELEALTLTAPRSGLVVLQEIWSPNGRAKVKIGDTPWRGMSLVEIPDLSEMMVMVNVNEVDINQVVEGQQAIIKVDALPNKTFYGIVSRVSSLASRERGSDVKNFKVEITIAGADPELRPGMTAQCQIITDRIQDQLYIPLESVFQEEDTTVVYVKKSGFEKRIVQLGPRNSDYVVVKAGLEAEDNVSLFNPTKPLQDLGKEIQPMEENNKKSNKNDEPEMLIIG